MSADIPFGFASTANEVLEGNRPLRKEHHRHRRFGRDRSRDHQGPCGRAAAYVTIAARRPDDARAVAERIASEITKGSVERSSARCRRSVVGACFR